MSAASYEAEVLAEVRSRLRERLAAAHEAGAPVEALGDPATVAELMTAAIPGSHPYDVLTGPFYDTPGLVAWLGISRQALHRRTRTYQLLACRTADGHTVYPAWQFTPDGELIPGLRDVLAVLLPAAADPWTVAVWLRTPDDTAQGKAGGLTAVAWLSAGRDPEPILVEARADAARWTQ